MTREEILKMPSGKGIDALVAGDVMGAIHWENGETKDYNGEYPMYSDWDEGVFLYSDADDGYLWTPSENLMDAWDLVEKLRTLGFHVRLEYQDNARATFFSRRMTEYGPEPTGASAKNIPLAICRAALLTVTETIK